MTALETAKKLLSDDSTRTCVICREGEILGIVTDGDVCRAMESKQAEFFNIRPMDIASTTPKMIHPEEKLIEAEKMMTQHK
ncbi:MAG: CBS domain-containing protein, partial [Oscillospiraceae bacterium]|nr:CBS domain-containing protein [Oscillospiraceae bacterium]